MLDCLIPRRDLDFLLHAWLRPDASKDDRETADAVLDLASDLAEEAFLSHYKTSDQVEPRLDADGVHVLPAIGAALRRYAEAGLFTAGFEECFGGMGMSSLMCWAIFAQFAAANVATAAYPMLTAANARLITTFGSASQIDAFAIPQIEGRWFGTMCLSEPQSGSSLADICTRATPWGGRTRSRYRLRGAKMWISGGDQDISDNIVHLVLAKIPDADGTIPTDTRGISLFITPKIMLDGSRNDIAVAGLNHKMGYRGTANCLLQFGERGGAVGWRVGDPGQGLAQMFKMMNEARIGVGVGAAALGYRGYVEVLKYARERTQGRLFGEKGGPPVFLIAHADVRRMLLSQKVYAEGALALCLYCADLVDDHDDGDAQALLGLLTPIAKTRSSQYGLAANDLAIQVLGGFGYARDFDVEQLYRDNRLNPIHEGATGIQAIDLLGRKILRDDGSGLAILRARLQSCCDLAAGDTELLLVRRRWLAPGRGSSRPSRCCAVSTERQLLTTPPSSCGRSGTAWWAGFGWIRPLPHAARPPPGEETRRFSPARCALIVSILTASCPRSSFGPQSLRPAPTRLQRRSARNFEMTYERCSPESFFFFRGV